MLDVAMPIYCNDKDVKPNDSIQHELDLALSQLDAHSLTDLDKANLMERVDVKFLLPKHCLPRLLPKLKNYYSVLQINDNRISNYENQYFDTDDMKFYLDHHNGKLNRYKVRQRTYLDTDTKFLEVKFKNNHRRTIKSRVQINQAHNMKANLSCREFIARNAGQAFTDLNLNHQSGYKRIALANEASAERLTLDFDLWFHSATKQSSVKIEDFFIAELKQVKQSKRSPFYQMMSQSRVFPSSFSKYCIGCALLYKENVKTNRFKPILHRINQFSALTFNNMSI